MEDIQLALLISMGLKALNFRILTLISVLCSMGLFCWAMFDPDWRRIAAATLGGIVFWCLVNLKGKDDATRFYETSKPDALPVRTGLDVRDGEQ
jgi:hypothetical protein